MEVPRMQYNRADKTITTERLKLRMFEKKDAETVQRLCNNYNIYKNTLFIPYPYTIEHALTWMQNHREHFDADKGYEFAITDKATGEIFGAIGLTHDHRYHNGELGYWIGEAFWGKGYATEAAKALVQFAFLEKNFHKVYARHFGSNPSSGRVIEKTGMTREGHLRDHVMKDDRYEDLYYYGILQKER